MYLTQKFFRNIFAFSIMLFLPLKTFADEAKIYCTSINGSWQWLPNLKINKRFALDFSAGIYVNKYNPPVIVYGKWKSGMMNNKKFNYFLIDGGKDLIDSLKNDCKKILGAEYIFAYPYHDSLMYSGYHIFSYLTEDGKYQFENNYVLEN